MTSRWLSLVTFLLGKHLCPLIAYNVIYVAMRSQVKFLFDKFSGRVGERDFHFLLVFDHPSLPISCFFLLVPKHLQSYLPFLKILSLLSVVHSTNIAQTTSGKVALNDLINDDPEDVRNKRGERTERFVVLEASILIFVVAKDVSVGVSAWLGRSSKGSKTSGQTANEANAVTVCSSTRR